MAELNQYDLKWCVQRLPRSLRDILKREEIAVAGGYIRSCITNDTVNDVDLFVPDAEYADEMATWLGDGHRKIKTTNAITVRGGKYPVQFITRWTYETPEDVLGSFDFTICQAAFWWDHYCQQWKSVCCDDYYADLAARRLVYTVPQREEEPGGSMLRVLKYYQKGFRITTDSYAKVIARLAHGVRFDENMVSYFSSELNEPQFAKIIRGLLREVDPNIDPDHIIHE
jgi:hypothetical protein